MLPVNIIHDVVLARTSKRGLNASPYEIEVKMEGQRQTDDALFDSCKLDAAHRFFSLRITEYGSLLSLKLELISLVIYVELPTGPGIFRQTDKLLRVWGSPTLYPAT